LFIEISGLNIQFVFEIDIVIFLSQLGQCINVSFELLLLIIDKEKVE